MFAKDCSDIKVKGLSIPNDQITLAYDENSLTIYFSCLDYAHADELMYRCYLEGADHTWREPSAQNSIGFNNLPPGKYVFHLQTTEGNDETLLAITIRQPWWNTWWAWMLYLLFIGIIAYTFYKHHREQFLLHQQLKVEKEVMDMRTRLFTSITHEFRTPLADWHLSHANTATNIFGEHVGKSFLLVIFALETDA